MAEQVQTGAAADAAGAGSSASAQQAGAAAGGSPNQPPADAGGGSGRTAAQEAAFWKAEADKAFAARDAAKAAARAIEDSPEMKALREKADRLTAREKADEDAKTTAAKEQGKFKDLYEQELAKREQDTAERKKLEQKLADATRTHQLGRIRDALSTAYTRANGIDPEVFTALVEARIAKGDVKVTDDGQIVGVEETMKDLLKSKPFLFKAGASVQGAGAGDIGAGDIAAGAAAATEPQGMFKPGASLSDIQSVWRRKYPGGSKIPGQP